MLEQIQIIWQACFELERYGDNILLNNWETYCQNGVKAARSIHHSKKLQELILNNASVEEAFEFTTFILNKI